jgi:hypothetical protein
LAVGGQRLADLASRSVEVSGVTVSRVDTFDDRFDALWERARWNYSILLIRDRRYLQWRFMERPDARYTTFIVTRGLDLVGYLVMRSTEKSGTRWGYIVDFLVDDRSVSLFALLVRHGIEQLRQESIKAIGCRAVTPPFRRALYRQGFVRGWSGPRGYLRINAETTHPRADLLLDARLWFVTMGDGDLEMTF